MLVVNQEAGLPVFCSWADFKVSLWLCVGLAFTLSFNPFTPSINHKGALKGGSTPLLPWELSCYIEGRGMGGGGGGARVFSWRRDPLFLHFVNRTPLKNCSVNRDWRVFRETWSAKILNCESWTDWFWRKLEIVNLYWQSGRKNITK